MAAAPLGAGPLRMALEGARGGLQAQPRHKSQLSGHSQLITGHQSQRCVHKSQLRGLRPHPGARAMATKKGPPQGPKPRDGPGPKPRERPGPTPRDDGSVLGREAEEQRRQEFVYGPCGPYSHRAPVKGKAQGPNLTAPFLSCMYSSVKTDREQEEADQVRMAYEYEKALRRYRGRARARARKGLPYAGPISYFFAFVAKAPPPPSAAQLWDGWTLVAQVAVEHPSAKAPAEGPPTQLMAAQAEAPQSQALQARASSASQARPNPIHLLPADSSASPPVTGGAGTDRPAETGGREASGAPAEGQRLAAGPADRSGPGPVDRWELPGRMSGRAMQQLMECVGWYRPDLVYVKKPALELRFELQEEFFRGLAGLPEPPTTHSTAGGEPQYNDNSAQSYRDREQGARVGGADDAPEAGPGDSESVGGARGGRAGGMPGARRALRAEGVMAAICRVLGLDPWMEPSAEAVSEAFGNASGRRQAEVLSIVFDAALGKGGDFPGEFPRANGATAVQDNASPAQPPTASRGTPESAPDSATATEAQEAGVLSSYSAPDNQDDSLSVDGPEGNTEGTPRVARKRLERISLTGKARSQGALGKGAWTLAICPYDYKRLVFEVCTLLKEVSANHALP